MVSQAERIATLEANHKTLDERTARMETNLQEVHDVLLQAKGARWLVGLGVGFLMLVATVVGAFAMLLHNK
jgi:hypothetical protein